MSGNAAAGLRLGVYTDYTYELLDGDVYAERAFALFLARVRRSVRSLTVIGRLRPEATGAARYPLGPDVELTPLPYYASLARPLRALPALARSLRAFWGALDDLDAVWLLGPHPLAIAFAFLARTRRRRVVLGVRQDLPAYMRTRHPGRRAMAIAADLLEGAFRRLGRRMPVVAVGPELAANYADAARVCEIVVSLIDEDSIISIEAAMDRNFNSEISVLSVGRLDTEKNPLLMIEALAALEERDPGRWKLVICGEGPSEQELRARLAELGLTERCEMRGYVSWGPELTAAYADAHLLLHVSRTEGFPQVLLEAFAAGLPTVATDVGGIRAAVGNAAVLVPPDDAGAIVEALRALSSEEARRRRLVGAGLSFVRDHTLAGEAGRVAAFIAGDGGGPPA